MSNMQATLRALLGRAESLPELAGQASDLLFASTAPEKYVTAALADLEPRTGAIRFVGAGHVDTLILRANGDTVTLGSTGTPLGLLPPLMPYGEVNLMLDPGDTLVLFSDGVTEAQNADEEEYGEARLVECLRGVADQPAAVMIERAHDLDRRLRGRRAPVRRHHPARRAPRLSRARPSGPAVTRLAVLPASPPGGCAASGR